MVCRQYNSLFHGIVFDRSTLARIGVNGSKSKTLTVHLVSSMKPQRSPCVSLISSSCLAGDIGRLLGQKWKGLSEEDKKPCQSTIFTALSVSGAQANNFRFAGLFFQMKIWLQ
jgi:hypothetical protein